MFCCFHVLTPFKVSGWSWKLILGQMPFCSSEKMPSRSLLHFCLLFDCLNAVVVNIQYTYSCINVHCCSASILCCGICGAIKSAAVSMLLDSPPPPPGGLSTLCHLNHAVLHYSQELQWPKPVCWLLIQAQATPSHLVQGQFQRNHTNHGSILSQAKWSDQTVIQFSQKDKSYLKLTMTHRRLNNIMVLHVHKNQTDQLSLIEVGNEFVQLSDHCRHLFGKFLPTD